MYWTKDLDNWNKENKAVVIDRDNAKEVKGAIGMPSVIRVETGWRCCTTVLRARISAIWGAVFAWLG